VSRNNRIFLTSWGFPTQDTKGNPFVKEIAEAICRKGTEVVVIIPEFVGLRTIFSYRKKHSIKSGNLLIKEVPIFNFIPSVTGLLQVQKYLQKLQFNKSLLRIAKEVGMPDAVQFHYILYSSGYLFTSFMEKNKIPYVLFEHSPGSSFIQGISKGFGGFDTLPRLKQFVKGASLRIARIQKYQKKLEEVYECEFELLASFISTEYESLKIHDSDLNNDPTFKFVSVGSLIPRKNFELLIDSFHAAFKDVDGVSLTIVGGGPLETELLDQIAKLGLQKRVRLMGEIRKPEVLRHIVNSHSLVVSSKHETFGNTVIEGMYCGKPVVSTKCDGPETILTPETGILCEKNAESLAQAMIDMCNNYNQFDSGKIKQYCIDHYSEGEVMGKLSVLYKNKLSIDI